MEISSGSLFLANFVALAILGFISTMMIIGFHKEKYPTDVSYTKIHQHRMLMTWDDYKIYRNEMNTYLRKKGLLIYARVVQVLFVLGIVHLFLMPWLWNLRN